MTTNYFIPPDHFAGDHVDLPEEEVRHAVRVLRRQPGDEITAVDGLGGWYRIRLEQVEKRHASGRVLETDRDRGEPAYSLTLAVGMQKQAARLELILEKGVELGVARVVPLATRRAERERLNADRAERILIAALKQCGRSRLPLLDPPTPWEALLESSDHAHRYLCHERGEGRRDLITALPAEAAGGLIVAVGPEGGFDPAEVESGIVNGWQAVSLGPRRLRTETAALAAAAVVMTALDRPSQP